MAVEYDNSASKTEIISGNQTVSLPLVITKGSLGSNLLWIGIRYIDNQTGGDCIEGEILSSVDVDGNPATFVASRQNAGFSQGYYYLINSTGTYTVNANFTGDCGANVVLGLISLKNVDTNNPIGTPVTAAGTISPITVDVTGTSTDKMCVDSVGIGNASTATLLVGAGQSQRWNDVIGAASARQRGAGSHETSTVGTVTMSWTISTAKVWSTVAVEVNDAALESGLINKIKRGIYIGI